MLSPSPDRLVLLYPPALASYQICADDLPGKNHRALNVLRLKTVNQVPKKWHQSQPVRLLYCVVVCDHSKVHSLSSPPSWRDFPRMPDNPRTLFLHNVNFNGPGYFRVQFHWHIRITKCADWGVQFDFSFINFVAIIVFQHISNML